MANQHLKRLADPIYITPHPSACLLCLPALSACLPTHPSTFPTLENLNDSMQENSMDTYRHNHSLYDNRPWLMTLGTLARAVPRSRAEIDQLLLDLISS